MISGDRMKKRITVKRKHRYTNERDILYQGVCDFHKKSDGITLQYREDDKDASVQVEVFAYDNHIELKRRGETISHLCFEKGKNTKGTLTSQYGDLDIDLYTYQYIRKDQVITLEYDILNGEEVTGGYRIIWNIKEE